MALQGRFRTVKFFCKNCSARPVCARAVISEEHIEPNIARNPPLATRNRSRGDAHGSRSRSLPAG